MKTTQYVRAERAIAAATAADIRERWLWGLRLLRDAEAFAPGSGQLRPGITEQIVAAARTVGLTLTDREIRYRLQCARAYPTEVQIRHAGSEFSDWTALRTAGFPAFPAPAGEPVADHRTDAERQRDHARALAEMVGDQGAFFPLSDFEPVTTTLKELADYAEQQEDLTARFVEHGRKRREYLDSLIEAAGNDLSVTWQVAHDRLAAEPSAAAS